MAWGFKSEGNRTVISQDGVARVAINEDGSMELLTPAANPTGNKVPTVGQLPFTKEYVSPEQVITVGGAITLAHGLGAKPKLMSGSYICKAAEAGWSVGDEFNDSITYAYTDAGATITTTGGFDASNLYIVFQNASGSLRVRHKTTGAIVNITPANWRFIARAWA